MESVRFYRWVFYAGGVWNFLASVPTLFLVGSLPEMIQIDAPLYPIFIYFNLMTMMMYGFIQFAVARHMDTARPFVKILVWAKMLTVAVFVACIFLLPTPRGLIDFLAPGIALDLVFGSLFWRYLAFSAKPAPTQ